MKPDKLIQAGSHPKSLKQALASLVSLLLLLLALKPLQLCAQYFDLSPSAYLAEVPRFTVPFTLELRIYNAGPDNTSGVTVTHTVPAGMSVISADVNHFLWPSGTMLPVNLSEVATINSNVVQFHIGSLPANCFRKLFVRLVVPATGNYTTQTVISPMPWELGGNNSLSFPVEVRPHGLVVRGGSVVPEESGGSAIFTVELIPSNSVPVTVDYTAVGGTATAGEDFVPVTGSLLFPPGVTTRTVTAPVLDDTYAEASVQSFTIGLTNAVNAEVDPNPQPGWVSDNEPTPAITISNAPAVLEGDGEEVYALFGVGLSGQPDAPILINYSVEPAIAPNGVFEFPAYATNATLAIPIQGNLATETNRPFQVTLQYPLGVTVAQGLVLDDDAIPGKFHHLVMDPVPTPQIAGRPIPVTLRALDFEGQPVTNFTRTLSLGIYDFGGGQSHRFIDVSNFIDGVAVAYADYANATTQANLAAWLWMGYYYTTANCPLFKVIPSPQIFLSLPSLATEGNGVLTNAGQVTITNVDVQPVVVQLTSSDSLEIQLPPSVIIPVGQTSAVFNVTVADDDRLDGTHGTSITAGSPGYLGASGAVTVNDNDPGILGVILPGPLYEGSPIINGTITVNEPVATTVQVTMSTSDATELVAGTTAFISQGETNGTFWVSVREDSLIDGDQPVTITAHVPNWIDGSASTVVHDNDTNLSVSVVFGNKGSYEGSDTVTNGLRIQLPGTNSTDVEIQLVSSDTTEVIVPSGVIIPAGQLLATTNLTIVDDGEIDGSQPVTISAISPPLNTGVRAISIFDNDPHHFQFTTVSSPQTSGVPFLVRFNARDINDSSMWNVAGEVALHALAGSNSIFSSPSLATNKSTIRNNTSWQEWVTVNGWGTNVQIRASMTSGVSTLSPPFNVLPTPALSSLKLEVVGMDAESFVIECPTISGLHYQLERTTSLNSPTWNPLEPRVLGTSEPARFHAPRSAPDSSEFYRVSVSPY